MYADWMENTPIFGKIKDIYIGSKIYNLELLEGENNE